VLRVVARYLSAGAVALSWRSGLAQLDLTLAGWPDARFFARTALRLDRLLGHTHATPTLRIEEPQAQHAAHLQRLLARPVHHGNRAAVVVHEKLRALVPADSSVFNFVLGTQGT